MPLPLVGVQGAKPPGGVRGGAPTLLPPPDLADPAQTAYAEANTLPRGECAMPEAYICDFTRTPIGRYGGVLKDVRTDDLAAQPIRVLMDRHKGVDWEAVDDVIYGCANQAGEDNRNVARMALLLAGLPDKLSGATVNRLCGSGLDAVGTAARAIRAGEAELMIAGGVESMTRAPFVMGKATEAFSRSAEIYDTTIGWRFVNPLMKKPVRRRFDAGDGGERRRGVPDQPRRPGRLRLALAAAHQGGAGGGFFDARDHPGRDRRAQGQRHRQPRRASARRHHAGRPRQAADAVPQAGRHGDRRQRLRRQRRRRGADHRLGGGRAAATA